MTEEESTEETVEEPWVGDKEEGYRIILGKKSIPVNAEDNFVDKIKDIADDEGISKFKVIYDDQVILPTDAPKTFEDFPGKKIVLEVIDEGG